MKEDKDPILFDLIIFGFVFFIIYAILKIFYKI